VARYLARRLTLATLIVGVAMAILFSAVHLVPGDPASVALGPRATPEMREEFRVRMGLDRPLPVQFALFVGNVVRGDLGTDIWSRQSVASLVWRALPSTVALTAIGLGWAVLVGIPLGCFSAAHRGSWLDRATGVLSVSAIALPSFIVAIYSLLVFAVWLKWFPAIGAGRSGDLANQLWHLVLPSLAIGLGWVGFLARLVRASMLEVLGENHIRAARALGLPERRIVYRYALRLAILPTVAAGAWNQRRFGHLRVRTAVVVGLASVVGVEVGARIVTELPENVLRRLFAVLLFAVAAQLVWRTRRSSRSYPESS